MAEGVFRGMVAAPSPYASLISRIDSCGTAAYHVDESPDGRTMATLEVNGVKGYVHGARKVSEKPSLFPEWCGMYRRT